MTQSNAPNFPIAPELFDVLLKYAKDIEQGEVLPTPSMGATSPALTFCENFYSQFFKYRLKQPILRINFEAKKAAVRLRLTIKDQNGPPSIILLITSFEKLCDDYPNLLALGYGVAVKTIFFDFHDNYLLTLLNRAVAWAEAENYAEIKQKAELALSDLKKALQIMPR
jgi:hypothetical protein